MPRKIVTLEKAQTQLAPSADALTQSPNVAPSNFMSRVMMKFRQEGGGRGMGSCLSRALLIEVSIDSFWRCDKV